MRGCYWSRLVVDFDKIIPIVEQSKLVFVPNPNSPSAIAGRGKI